MLSQCAWYFVGNAVSLGAESSLSSAGTGNSRNKFEILANLDEDCSVTLVSFLYVEHFLAE